MNSKIQAATIVSVLYLVISIVYFLNVVENIIKLEPLQVQLVDLRNTMFRQYKTEIISTHLDTVEDIFSKAEPCIDAISSSFMVIDVLAVANFLFIIEHAIHIIFLNKIRRKYQFPDILHFTDLVLAVASIYLLNYSYT